MVRFFSPLCSACVGLICVGSRFGRGPLPPFGMRGKGWTHKTWGEKKKIIHAFAFCKKRKGGQVYQII